MKNLRLLVLLLVASAVRGDVLVLVEPRLEAYGGCPTVPPATIARLLGGIGVKARSCTVAELLAMKAIDPAEHPVLVMAYGNAFPLPLLEMVRAYRKAGGAMALNGVPFTHPCERDGKGWRDLGHVNYRGHDGKGLGTGGFAGVKKGTHRFAKGNPLRLADDGLLPERIPQGIALKSLPKEDRVIPIVQADGGCPSALIEHHCAQFRGAVDLWTGQLASGMTAEACYLGKQLYLRGVVHLLSLKGVIPEDRARQVFAKLDANPRPREYRNLTPVTAPRPWGDTWLPKSRKPADHLLAVNMYGKGMRSSDRVALGCLQALTNRRQPRIWILNHVNGLTHKWLDWHKTKGHVKAYTLVEDWKTLFARFPDAYQGAIVPDPALYRGEQLAVNIAACEDYIVATPELARELGIPVKEDLRGRHKTYGEGLRDIWRRYRGRLSRHLCDFVASGRMNTTAFAYTMQWRGILLWVVGPKDAVRPGADFGAEMAIVQEILSEMAPNSPALGFPTLGPGVGLGEWGGVSLLSKFGRPLTATDHLMNAGVMSGYTATFRQKPQPEPPKLGKGKVYIALNLSDGDNMNPWINYYGAYFRQGEIGAAPFALGMGPAIADVMPGVAQWYYEHASPVTEFICDVSGVGYIHPQAYGTAFANEGEIYGEFLRWTVDYMKRMDMKTVRPVVGDDDVLRRYAKGMPDLRFAFADMGYPSETVKGIDAFTYTLDDVAVFRSVTGFGNRGEKFLDEIRRQVKDTRPAFVNGFVHCWTWKNLDDVLDEIVRQADPDMAFVTPSQLHTLYRQAKRASMLR
ncbi:hypothetical protein HQ560_04285 [bacterium]|nr:hypothetical protein [bacterium]